MPKPRPDLQEPGQDPVRLYLDGIGRHPLLTKEEEASLGELVQQGVAARAELAAADGGGPQLTLLQRRRLERAVRDGDAAATRFVESNLRLVVSVAKRYQHTGLPLLDLIQEGNLGLMHAVEKFDWRKGFKFSTYATWWIRQSITRGVSNTARTIRVPVHAEDLLRAYDRTMARLEADLHRRPTITEVAAEIHTDPAKLTEVLASARVVSSTDEDLTDDGDITFGEVAAVADDDPAGDALAEVIRQEVRDALEVLNDRERQILTLRFGLDCEEPRTLEEVSVIFGLTRERIRQLEAKALSKLRHPTVGDGLR